MKKLMLVLVLLALLVVPSTVMAGKSGNIWHVPGDFATIQEAIDSPDVAAGDTILVGPGNHTGALVTKPVEIRGEDGTVINNGPVHSSGLVQGFRLLAGSDGTVISHLRFEVDLAIMNGGAVNDVTVTHCTFENTIQGISNWRGSGWEISHNEISDLRTHCGGGIGILVADFSAVPQGVKDNEISHNKISGVLHIAPDDCGGYNGTGIVLYADFRWGGAGAEEISQNRIVHNQISLTSDTPEVVDVVAIELTDTRDDEEQEPVIFDNAIGFNDLRGTVLQIDPTPDSLADVNYISRNLGDNRGHGLHPSVFSPGD
jgi:hypothetical protein